MTSLQINSLTPAAQSAMLRLEQQLSPGDRAGMQALLGKRVEIKILENLDGGRSLVELNGSRLVAEGGMSLAAGGVYPAEVVGVSPVVSIRLLDVAPNLPPGLREALVLLLDQPNSFAGRLGELAALLPELGDSLPAGLLEALENFSGDRILGKLGMEMQRLPEFLGLTLEKQLGAPGDGRGALLSHDFSSFLDPNLKGELLKAGHWLAGQPQSEEVAKLAALVEDSLSLVTLNQLYNNAGIKQFNGLFLIFPLILPDHELDVWLKIKQHEKGHQGGEMDPLVSLSFYLEFPDFGRTGTRIMMMSKEAVVSIQVSGKKQQDLLRKQVPDVQQQLAGLLSKKVSIRVESVPESRLQAFWQENFLGDLPGLLDVQV